MAQYYIIIYIYYCWQKTTLKDINLNLEIWTFFMEIIYGYNVN